MGIFHLFKKETMTQGLAEFEQDPKAVLIDVRTEEEYAQGHIPGSVNICLSNLDDVPFEVPDLETPLYLYCLSGARSCTAAAMLEEMGYKHVTDLGGIHTYKGKVEQ